jgi:hypothetical protein
MRVGAIQSNYIPWRGYFDFIDDCDLFIFYDDVLYTHKSWRNRNCIKTHSGLVWLSVPVIHDQQTLIENALIDYSRRWIEKHIRSLSLNYQKSPYFYQYADGFFDILRTRPETISKLNTNICRWIMKQLDITTTVRMSSELEIKGDRFERPLKILKYLNATSYLSGPAAKAYTDTEKFRAEGIKLDYKVYDYPVYPQIHGDFEPNVTALDLLFNCGSKSRDFLKSQTPNERIVV